MSLLIAIDDVGEGLAVKYAVVFTDCDRIVGNPYLITLRQSCPSPGHDSECSADAYRFTVICPVSPTLFFQADEMARAPRP